MLHIQLLWAVAVQLAPITQIPLVQAQLDLILFSQLLPPLAVAVAVKLITDQVKQVALAVAVAPPTALVLYPADRGLQTKVMGVVLALQEQIPLLAVAVAPEVQAE